jgi:heptaprenyl diphosphate synthase
MTKKITQEKNIMLSFEKGYELVRKEVDNTLSASPLAIRRYMKHLAQGTGKFIRASSLLASSMDAEDHIHPNAVKLAAAMELIHLATLVHDDIIDDAETRRGELSLQKKYGRRTAVICGDYLLCIALKKASEVEIKENFVSRDIPDYLSKVCLGELSQHTNNGNYDITTYRYLKIIAGKTAAMFEAAFHGGAFLIDEDLDVARKYAKLGKYIGMIFQITDDCMDFEATESVAKKPVRSDYDQNVITLPLIFAIDKVSGLKDYLKEGKASREDIDRAVRDSKGLEFARTIAKRYYEKSLAVMDEIELSCVKREKISDILVKAYRTF